MEDMGEVSHITFRLIKYLGARDHAVKVEFLLHDGEGEQIGKFILCGCSVTPFKEIVEKLEKRLKSYERTGKLESNRKKRSELTYVG